MARILALPVAVVVVLLVLVAAGPVRTYRESRNTSRSVGLALAVQNLVHELQNERGVASLVLGGNESFRGELTRVRQDVDSARADLAALADADGAVETRVRSALAQLDGLGPVRAATDSGAAERQATFRFYTERITNLSRVDVGLSTVSDRALARDVALLQSLQDAAEATAQERAFLSGVFSAGGFGEGEFVEFAAMRAAKQSAWERFFSLADGAERASARHVLQTGAARVVSYFEQVAVAAAGGQRVTVNPQSWWSGHTTVLDGITGLQEHVGSVIRLRAFDLQQEATLRLAALLTVVLLCIGGSIYLAVLASLSVSRPLAALATEAETVATERLPAAMERLRDFDPGEGTVEPVPPQPAPVDAPRRAGAEIRSVVSALNHLQEAAYRLAVEQAMQRRATLEALTNLGRRNQNLVRKQLRFISNLEREEMDPTALSNLFELDHLATRMRRNAASLLVLTSASSPGQWTTPAPIADVVRAAVSEVEDYRRVALRRVDEALLSGAVVGSLAHLLSELIENGLRFSPPDSEVEVVGRLIGDEYLIAVVDQGVGMRPEELARANARLRGEGDFVRTPSRFLGHFVVGRLAEQTGVRVELLQSPVTGVTARIHVPDALLVRSRQIAPGQVISSTDGAAAPRPAQQPPSGAVAAVTGHIPTLAEPAATGHPSDHPSEDDGALRPVAEHQPIPADRPFEVVVDLREPGPTVAAQPMATAHPADRAPVPAAEATSQGIPLGPRTPAHRAGPVADPVAHPAGRLVREDEDAAPAPVGSIFDPSPGPAPNAAPAGSATSNGRAAPPGSVSPNADEPSAATPFAATPFAGGPPVVDAPPPAHPVEPGGTRTRNGLRVRVPGSTRPAGRSSTTGGSGPTATGSWPAPVDGGWPPPSGPPVDRRPVEVTAAGQLGSRLSALRSGMRRGYDRPTPDEAADTEGSTTDGGPGHAGRMQTEDRS